MSLEDDTTAVVAEELPATVVKVRSPTSIECLYCCVAIPGGSREVMAAVVVRE